MAKVWAAVQMIKMIKRDWRKGTRQTAGNKRTWQRAGNNLCTICSFILLSLLFCSFRFNSFTLSSLAFASLSFCSFSLRSLEISKKETQQVGTKHGHREC